MSTEQFIGMKISLTSRAQLRYRGTVHSIDSSQGTMTLKEVTSMGTEDRQVAQYIPPMLDRVHPVVVFTVNDILDLAIEPVAPPASQTLPDDPAIRQSTQAANGLAAAPSAPSPVPVPAAYASSPQPRSQPPFQEPRGYPPPGPHSQQPRQPVAQQQFQRGPPLHTSGAQPSAPSLSTIEKIEQTVGEIRSQAGPSHAQGQGHFANRGGFKGRVSVAGPGRGFYQNQPGSGYGHGPGPGSRGPPGGHGPVPPSIPDEEYDFEQMNRRFEEMRTKESRGSISQQGGPEVVLSSSAAGKKPVQQDGSDDDDDDEEEVVMSRSANPGREAENAQVEPVYNKSKSFFDSVSSDVSWDPTASNSGGRGGRGGFNNGPGFNGQVGGGGGGFKWQRSQERMTNLNTFGEAGGNTNYGNGRGRGGFNRGRGGAGRGGFRGGAHPPPPSGYAGPM